MYIKTEFGVFEWDDAKAEVNWHKHGVRFIDAIRIFEGFVTEKMDERKNYGEKREITFGEFDGAVIIAVVHTRRGEAKRLISARPANRKERGDFTTARRRDAGAL